MCGIAGMVTLTGNGQLDVEALDRMVECLHARGPDDQGTCVRPPVAMGMRRLSIIDIETGHQPITSEDGNVIVVSNGELYSYVELRAELLELGHHFRTTSDTEVIVHGYEAWGIEGLLRRIDGMFAFALYDVNSSTVHLVRDRLGIKPLFYTQHDNVLYFASSIPALLAPRRIPMEVDPIGVRLYLHQQFVSGPSTIMAGVGKVPPGSFVSIVEGRVREARRYWSLPNPALDHRPEHDWHEALCTMTDDAVCRHMRADVEVGVLLSGGLDSSIVLGLMAAYSERPVAAFTVGIAGAAFDETEYARLAASRFGARLHHTEMTAASFATAARTVVEELTEPVGDPACVPLHHVADLARRHVKVVLSGEGADELFSGYGYYRHLASRRERVLQRCKRFATRGRRSASSGYPFVMSGARAAALTPGFRGIPALDRVTRSLETAWVGSDDADPINRAARIDIRGFLADDLLPKVDSATMAHGLEARVPFLDHRIVELAMAIPGRAKRRGREGKLVVRGAFRGLIGDDLATRPKHGFSLPMASWFRGPLRPLLHDMTDDLGATPWLDRRSVARMVDEHLAGVDHGRALWSIYTLVTWYRSLSGRRSGPIA